MRDAIIKIGSCAAVFVLLTFLQSKINRKKIYRHQQALFPIAALIYGLLAVGLMIRFEVYIAKFIKSISEYISILNKLPIFSCFVIVLNVFVFVVYLLVKAAGVLVSKVSKWMPGFKEKIIKFFYEKDEDYKEWFLMQKWKYVRSLFKWLSYGISVFGGALLGIIWHSGGASNWFVYIFPVLSAIVVTEIAGFLGGYTKTEFSHDVVGDDSYAVKVTNYYRIREIFEKHFPGNLLSSSSGCEYASAQSVKDLLEKYEDTEDRYEQIVSEFFEIHKIEEVYDTDCIEATLKLMKGQNVVFLNPFYRDLGKYIILPLMNTLLEGQKCLVIVGRNSTREDISEWLSEILWEYGKIRSLWRVANLSVKEPDCEVGILSFSQLYDVEIQEANLDFFKNTGFVFMMEPSLIVNTSQIGLSILSQTMARFDEQPTYCICDRMANGLVDTMSHLLHEEITEVVAPPVARNLHTNMSWDADGDYLRQKMFGKQTKYLGNGMELAAVAVKNQVPKVTWYGETKVPIRDIKWITGQYYANICRYMNVPVQQQSIYDHIRFVANIWSVAEEREQFVIAEDEFCNLFGMMRTFLSRGKSQTFVNVMSENYLLRDYMRLNPKMFDSNPDAIPSMVPDYAKTERNTLLKLLIAMNYRPVTEEEILKEFRLAGIEDKEPAGYLNELLEKYTTAPKDIFTVHTVPSDEDSMSFESGNLYSVTLSAFEQNFSESLKNAYYICEEEKDASEYIDSKLYGHVLQTILPGQLINYDGKCYYVNSISPVKGVVLRRASQLYDGRKYYRQIRKYVLETDTLPKPTAEQTGELSPSEMQTEEQQAKPVSNILSKRTVMGMEITKLSRNFRVHTTGYLESERNDDIKNARLIDFTDDPSTPGFVRKIKNKTMLRLDLPGMTEEERFTFCSLLSEMFKTIYPNAWQYIAVTTRFNVETYGVLQHLIYSLEGETEDHYIYIIEDSDIDLGLIESIEKNLLNYMEIMADYLDWHFEEIERLPEPEPEPFVPVFPDTDQVPADKKEAKKYRRQLKKAEKERKKAERAAKRAERKNRRKGMPENGQPLPEGMGPLGNQPQPEMPVDQMPVDQTPVDQMPVDQMPVDQMPMDQMPMDQMPMDQMPVDQMPMDQMPTDLTEQPEAMTEETEAVAEPVIVGYDTQTGEPIYGQAQPSESEAPAEAEQAAESTETAESEQVAESTETAESEQAAEDDKNTDDDLKPLMADAIADDKAQITEEVSEEKEAAEPAAEETKTETEEEYASPVEAEAAETAEELALPAETEAAAEPASEEAETVEAETPEESTTPVETETAAVAEAPVEAEPQAETPAQAPAVAEVAPQAPQPQYGNNFDPYTGQPLNPAFAGQPLPAAQPVPVPQPVQQPVMPQEAMTMQPQPAAPQAPVDKAAARMLRKQEKEEKKRKKQEEKLAKKQEKAAKKQKGGTNQFRVGRTIYRMDVTEPEVIGTQNPTGESLEEAVEDTYRNSPNETRYQKECYTKFGFDDFNGAYKLDGIYAYLTKLGLGENQLKLARTRSLLEDTVIDLEAMNHCDFCGMPLTGVSFERLTDGRCRCNDCSASAINSVEEFKEIFYQNKQLMESIYGIDYRAPISVKTVDARAVAKAAHSVYSPSTEFTARVLGFAQHANGRFNLCIENGSPRLATIETMVHEMTHIWQYLNWDMKALNRLYPTRQANLIVMEGMAMWASIQYLYLIGEVSYAAQEELLTLNREDEYGIGFAMYCSKYPLIKDSSLVKNSPFKTFPPL